MRRFLPRGPAVSQLVRLTAVQSDCAMTHPKSMDIGRGGGLRARQKSIMAMLVAALACVVTLMPRPAPAAVFNPETFTLDNGMQVVLIPNHRVPVVTQMIWYKVGSADEPAGKSGIAHFLEHLMFKATKETPSGQFSQIVARNGGRDNAFTSKDYTAYHESVAADRHEMFMKLEAQRMTDLLFDPHEVETERKVVLEERRMRTDNSPAARLSEQVNAALFVNYPYGKPVIGWEHEIRALTIKDLKAFYKRWYVPNNAILIVSGDITMDRLRPLAEKYFGVIPRGPDVVRSRPQEPPHDVAKCVTMRDARVRQPSWRRMYMAPSYSTKTSDEAYGLEVLGEILGSGATSRLYRSLVVEHKIAITAGAYYDGDNRGPSTFGIYASPRPGVSMETLQEKVRAVVATLLRDGVTEDEVDRAKKRMQAEAVYARDSLGAGGRVVGSALSVGQTIDDVESWPERIGAVTVDQVNAAARAVLVDDTAVTGLLLPETKTSN
jgi:zinc protease